MLEPSIGLERRAISRIKTLSCQKAQQVVVVQWKLDSSLGKRPRGFMSFQLENVYAKRCRKLYQDRKQSGNQGRLAANKVVMNHKIENVQEGPDRLSSLSDDILAHIFQFLDFPAVRRSISRISQRLHQGSISKQFTNSVKRLSISGPALHWFSPISLCRLLSRLGQLHELRFTGCGDVLDDNVMNAIASGVSHHLQKLDVDWCGSVSDVGVKAVIKACPNLICFTLFKGRSASNNGQDVTDEALRLISKRCPKLRRLCLTYTQLTKKGIKQFAESTDMVVVKLLSNRSLSWGPTCTLLEKR